MHEPIPVEVVMTFRIPATAHQCWKDTWSALRELALEIPECAAFELSPPVRDRVDGAIVTSWRSRHDFNRFVRESGLLWIDRVRRDGCACPDSILVSAVESEARASARMRAHSRN